MNGKKLLFKRYSSIRLSLLSPSPPLSFPCSLSFPSSPVPLPPPPRYCEESLAESVATLIWVAPRLCSDVQELNQVALQLENKFGKPFAQQARSNMSGTVNPKVS